MNNKRNLISSIIILVETIFLIILIAFGVWSYSAYKKNKTNLDQKINQAVIVAKKQQSSVDASNYATQSQYPLANYTGPQIYGSVSINYPKNWSAYVDSTGSSTLLDGYFNPGYVMSINSPNSTFALRAQIINQSYSQTLASFTSQEQAGLITTKPYSLPKLPQVVGVMLTGQVQNNLTGEMVVLPLRNETLQFWTIGTNYLPAFSNIILPNLTFSP